MTADARRILRRGHTPRIAGTDCPGPRLNPPGRACNRPAVGPAGERRRQEGGRLLLRALRSVTGVAHGRGDASPRRQARRRGNPERQEAGTQVRARGRLPWAQRALGGRAGGAAWPRPGRCAGGICPTRGPGGPQRGAAGGGGLRAVRRGRDACRNPSPRFRLKSTPAPTTRQRHGSADL